MPAYYDTQEFMKKCNIVHQNFTTRLIAKGILNPVKRAKTGKMNWYTDKDVTAFQQYLAGVPTGKTTTAHQIRELQYAVGSLKLSLADLESQMAKQASNLNLLKRVVTALTSKQSPSTNTSTEL